ncbi:MAG: inositol monophosphatase family protein, partial [Xanthomonadales bacterium]|nr:inositol monophosphatase family protein [Xanthomonadales bacterium]
WIVDPLDGTRNFIHDIPHFSISIALRVHGRIEHGVIYDPIREELFTASHGGGAFLNDRRIRVGDQKNLDRAMFATGFPFRARQRLDDYMRLFRAILDETGDVRRAGSAALDLAYVAAGRLDGFWELGLSPWDMAAGALLIQEAGGMATDFSGGRDFMETGDIVAGNLKIVAKLQQLIRANWKG